MFKVGTMVEIIHSTLSLNKGRLATVYGHHKMSDGSMHNKVRVHGVADPPGSFWRAPDSWLRKIKPPKSDFTACEPEFLEQLNRMRGKVGV